MLTFLGALAFGIGAICQAINGPDLTKAGAWPFWLLTGLCLVTFGSIFDSHFTLRSQPARPNP